MTQAEKEKIAKITDWLARQPLNVPLIGKVDERLREFVKNHPDYPNKFAGMSHFEIRINGFPGSRRSLYAVWPDGHTDVISYRSCISGRGESPHFTVKRAFREAFNDDIKRLRKPGYEVHHDPPFDQLFCDFLAERQLKTENIEVKENERSVPIIVNEIIRHQWQDYHRQHASVEALPKSVHKSLRRKTNVA